VDRRRRGACTAQAGIDHGGRGHLHVGVGLARWPDAGHGPAGQRGRAGP
jgi:hypothetical protein